MVGICFIIYLIPNAVILYRWFGLSLMIFFFVGPNRTKFHPFKITPITFCVLFFCKISALSWFHAIDDFYMSYLFFFSFSFLEFHFFQFLVSDFSCVNMARPMNGSLLFFLICKVLAGVIHYTEKDGWRHFCHACPFQEENHKCRAFHGGR